MSPKKQSFHLDVIPQPWRYNPSSWNQRIRIMVLAGVAALIAIYMGLYQWRWIDTVWDPVFGEQSIMVLDSDVSHTLRRWFIIPDAILGAIAYISDIIFALAGSSRRWQDRPWLVILFGIDVIPLGIVSATLVFLQGAVVGSWCFLCIVTAIISLVLVVLAYDEVVSSILYLHRVWKKGKNFKVLWDALWGRPSQAAHEAGVAIAKRRDGSL